MLDPIYVQNSADLVAQALKYGISVPPQEPDGKHYRRSGITGELILRQLAQRRLRREVRNEQRARNDEFRKWATVIFALLAFALGMVSLVVKTKQPDPCARNYYRNDAGACIFAWHQMRRRSRRFPKPGIPNGTQSRVRNYLIDPVLDNRRRIVGYFFWFA